MLNYKIYLSKIKMRNVRLTTFCLNSSSLSHFSLVTSCRRPSTRESFCASQHRLHGFPLGVSADDMLSRPVSLSTAPAMPRPSSSTLFRDDESLSDMATRLAPLQIRKKNYHSNQNITRQQGLYYMTCRKNKYLEVLCTG